MGANARSLARAKALRSSQTEAEQRLWYRLRAHRFLGVKFKREKPIGPYIVDFVAVEHGLVIEIDGGQHAVREEVDAIRTTFLEQEGYRVLRFWNHHVLLRTEEVLEQIRIALALGETLSPSPSPASGRGENSSMN